MNSLQCVLPVFVVVLGVIFVLLFVLMSFHCDTVSRLHLVNYFSVSVSEWIYMSSAIQNKMLRHEKKIYLTSICLWTILPPSFDLFVPSRVGLCDYFPSFNKTTIFFQVCCYVAVRDCIFLNTFPIIICTSYNNKTSLYISEIWVHKKINTGSSKLGEEGINET